MIEKLLSDGWVYSGKACKCSGGGNIYVKGDYSITIGVKTFKLKKGGKMVTHRRLNELDYWLQNKI